MVWEWNGIGLFPTNGVRLMEIVRKYAHKTYGDIAALTLVVPAEGWTLNGEALPEASVKHLATFALQSLQDAYAGSKSADTAKAAFEKKANKIFGGTIGTRATGPRDPVRTEAIGLALRFAPGADAKEKRANAILMVESNAAWMQRAQEVLDWAKAQSAADVAVPGAGEETDETDEDADEAEAEGEGDKVAVTVPAKGAAA